MESNNSLNSIVANMALAHEMIMTDNFQLTSLNDDETQQEKSLEKQVHDIVHKAFWDVLENEINADPPNYDNALELLKEMKELILNLITDNMTDLRTQIMEGFDMELITQQVEHCAFDIYKFAQFVLSLLEKLCAPVRDEKVNELRNTTDIVKLLRGIFELISLMKLDMANYEIKSIKPVLMQQAVQYEKQKFSEYLKENPDGLSVATVWLRAALQAVQRLSQSNSSRQLTPELVITNAYLSLIDPLEEMQYPETLYMDVMRLKALSFMFKQIAYLSSIMTVTLNFLGIHFSTDQSFVTHLKDKIKLLLPQQASIDGNTLENVYLQIVREADDACDRKGLDKNGEREKATLKNQIVKLCEEQNPVKLLIKSRVRDQVLLSISENKVSVKSPSLQPVRQELIEATQRFLRVILHNRNVYWTYYVEIVQNLLREKDEKS